MQVDYSATPEDIQAHFQACGTINRVTILCDKFTGHPKGCVYPRLVIAAYTNRLCRYAYVEFAEPEHVDAAVTMDNSLFKGRLIKVLVPLTLPSRHPLTSNPGDPEKDKYSWF